MIKNKDIIINVRKTFQGAYELSTTIYNYYLHMQYFDYTLKEAKKHFIEYVKEEARKNYYIARFL